MGAIRWDQGGRDLSTPSAAGTGSPMPKPSPTVIRQRGNHGVNGFCAPRSHEREGWRRLEVGEKASMAVEGHTGRHSSQRLVPQHGEAHGGCAGKGSRCWKFILELAITPSLEGCGHPDSTGLGTRVSKDFPRELFIGKRSCDPLHLPLIRDALLKSALFEQLPSHLSAC